MSENEVSGQDMYAGINYSLSISQTTCIKGIFAVLFFKVIFVNTLIQILCHTLVHIYFSGAF